MTTLPLANVFDPRDYGARLNGVADDTAPLNTTIVHAALAGGTVLLSGHCLCEGPVVVPSYPLTVAGGADGGKTLPVMHPVRITASGGPGWNGYWGAGIDNQCALLDLRYDGTDGEHPAKFTSLGAGFLELDHITLRSGGTDNFPFVQVTGTTIFGHHLAFQGNRKLSGVKCEQVAFVLGGPGDVISPGPRAPFQGYGTRISDVFMDNIAVAVEFQTYANAVEVDNITMSITCGSSRVDPKSGIQCGAPFVFTGKATNGCRIRGGTIEMSNQVGGPGDGHYSCAVAFLGENSYNILDGIGLWDAAPTWTKGVAYCGAGSVDNFLSCCFADPHEAQIPSTYGPAAANQVVVGAL